MRRIFTKGGKAGAVCEGRLTAKLRPGVLVLDHGEVPCTKGEYGVADTIECVNAPDGSASCVSKMKGQAGGQSDPEKFNRVPNDYCNWRPGR